MKIALIEREDIEVYLPPVVEAVGDANEEKILHLELANFTEDSDLITEISHRLQLCLQRNPQIEYIHVELRDYLENDLDNLSHHCLALLADFMGTHPIIRLAIEAHERNETEKHQPNFDGAYFFHLLYNCLKKKSTLKYLSLENIVLDGAASAALKSILWLNQLEALTLKGSRLVVEALFAGLAKNDTLKMLDLSELRGFHGGDAKKLSEVIQNHPSLVLLSLHHVNFRGKDIAALAELLKHNPTLQYLDFTNALMERDELIVLAKALAENTGLKALSLSAGESEDLAVNLNVLNTSAQMFGRAFQKNNTLIYCNLMRSCISPAAKKALIDGLSKSESLTFLYSKDTKEGELFKELATLCDEKYEKLKANKDMTDLERRWLELCKCHGDGFSGLSLEIIAVTLGLIDASLLPEWSLLSLSAPSATSVPSSSSDSGSNSSAEAMREASLQSHSSEKKEAIENQEEPLSKKRNSQHNEKEVKASSNPYAFRTPDAKRRKKERGSFSPVNLDIDTKSPSPQ